MLVVLVVVMGMTTQETFRYSRGAPDLPEFPAGWCRTVYRLPRRQSLCGTPVRYARSSNRIWCGLNFQGVHAHLGQTFNVGDGAQIFEFMMYVPCSSSKAVSVLARRLASSIINTLSVARDAQRRLNVRNWIGLCL